MSWRNAYTKVEVESNPWLRGPITNLYEAEAELVIEPGETITHWARLRYVATDIIEPVSGVDYNAVSSGMMDLSGDLTITMTAYAQQAKLELTNANAAQPVYVLDLVLRGYPLIGEQADKDEYEQTLDPVLVPGEKVYAVPANHFVQTKAQAVLLGSRCALCSGRDGSTGGRAALPVARGGRPGDARGHRARARRDMLVMNLGIGADATHQDMSCALARRGLVPL